LNKEHARVEDVSCVKEIRKASLEEVVSYYITSELKRLVEHADKQPDIAQRAIGALAVAGDRAEGALQHMSRALLGIWRQHSWLHDQFWGLQRRLWSLITIGPNEMDLMPLGGKADEFHYPKLNKAVEELREAAKRGIRVPGIHDEPMNLLTLRDSHPMLKRIILIEGLYGGRYFKYAIGDGAHRAISLCANGAISFEAYLGIPVS